MSYNEAMEPQEIDKQVLEIYETLPGIKASELRAALKAGEEMIGKPYLKWMRNINVLGDVSFVVELGEKVYLFSVYVHGLPPDNPEPYEEIPGMKEYQESLKPFFDENSKAIHVEAANSFWIDCIIKEQLG